MKRHGSIVSMDGSVDRGDRLMSPLTVAPEDAVIESRLFPFEFSCMVCHPARVPG